MDDDMDALRNGRSPLLVITGGLVVDGHATPRHLAAGSAGPDTGPVCRIFDDSVTSGCEGRQ
jgi:hypothetical protein